MSVVQIGNGAPQGFEGTPRAGSSRAADEELMEEETPDDTVNVPEEAEPAPAGGERYNIVNRTMRRSRRFGYQEEEITAIINIPPETADTIAWIRGAFTELHAYIVRSAKPSDRVGITFKTAGFTTGAAGMNARLVRDFSADDLWSLVFRITQSASEYTIDQAFTVRVFLIDMPEGSGKRVLNSRDVIDKRSVITIINSDNLCLPRSLVVGMAKVAKDQGDKGSGSLYDKIRKPNSPDQRRKALEFVRTAGIAIPEEGCGIEEIRLFQEALVRDGVVISVFDLARIADKDGGRIFFGEGIVTAAGQVVKHYVNILYDGIEKHYSVIGSLTGLTSSQSFCTPCGRGSHRHLKMCEHRCSGCRSIPACNRDLGVVQCRDCNRIFYGQDCLQQHLKIGSYTRKKNVCSMLKICGNCHIFVDFSRGKNHTCGIAYCKTCKSEQDIKHRCFIRPVKDNKDNRGKYIFVFYDFETQQIETLDGDERVNVHVPNLCVAQRVCSYCIDSEYENDCDHCGYQREFIFEEDPVRELLELVDRQVKGFKKTICIAHNAKGFDAQFILAHLVKNGQRPRLILNGTKTIRMDTHHARFLDSLAYMPMSLAALPKAFGLSETTRKGLFPHLFNTPANKGYKGILPAPEYYSPETMSVDGRREFFNWYNKSVEDGKQFDFDAEILAYCRSDVNILRLACIAFRDIFLKVGNVCPFVECTTIASTCSMLFRKKFLVDNLIAILPPGGYRLVDKQSRKAIEWLTWMEDRLGVAIDHAGNGRERRITEINRPVDGYYTAEDGSRHVLEFHGCYWHGCQACYSVGRAQKQAVGETMDRRLEKTREKTVSLTRANYTVTEMWECEFDRLMRGTPALKEFIANNSLLKTIGEKLNPRDAFYGGRTGNTSRFREVRRGEEIRYVDVCSLYPWVSKYGKFPVGHPEIYVGKKCQSLLTGDMGDYKIDRVEGLVQCRVLPPRKLYHPVLPLRQHGKLMFALCRSCCQDFEQESCRHEVEKERYLSGTWVSDELKKAVEMGYKIVAVGEIWHYREVRRLEPFIQYIDTFLKIKQESSGWPTGCDTVEEQDRYIAEYLEKEGIQLDRSKIVKNPGLRSVSKLCLNSFWGKFGQRDNLSQTTIVNSREQLLALATNPGIILEDILPVNEEIMYARWSRRDEDVEPSQIANVVIAAYTTAQARLKLYGYLEKLDRRVLYYDTDSVIYVRGGQPGEYEPPTGNFLGDLTDELDVYGEGSYIRSFVSGGAKFYAYIVERPGREDVEVCKVKGITLNYSTRMKINFESVRKMVVENSAAIKLHTRAIRRTALHQVVTRDESKTCQPVNVKRRLCKDNFDTLPYGYVEV